MRKLLTIFLAFSLLMTVFTVNTFALDENDVQGTSETPTEVLEPNTTSDSQEDVSTIEDKPESQDDSTVVSQTNVTDSQEASASQNEALPDFDITQEENGDILLTFESAAVANSVESIGFQEIIGSNIQSGPGHITKKNLEYDENKVIIKYAIISEALQYKKGSTYVANVEFKDENSFYIICKNITLSKGVDAWSATARLDENGDLIIESDNKTIVSNISNIYIYTKDYVEGKEINGLFNFDEVKHGDNYTYVPGNYINTFKFQQNVDYAIEVDYEVLYNEAYVSGQLSLNPIKFNYELHTGPELTGKVQNGILYIESNDEVGKKFIETFWANTEHYLNESFYLSYRNGQKYQTVYLEHGVFSLYEDTLQLDLLDESMLRDFNIDDTHMIQLRVPGMGLCEITFITDEESMKPFSAIITQNTNGDIIIGGDPGLNLKNVDSIALVSIKLDENDNINYSDIFSRFSFNETGDIVIPYSEIEYSLLKGGMDYKVSLRYDNNIIRVISDSYRLEKGSVRKDVPQYTVTESKNGDILITFDDPLFLNYELFVQLHKLGTYEYISFEDDSIVKDFENKVIKIPYVSIKKSQLLTGNYAVEFTGYGFYDNFFYFYNPQIIEITKGTTLAPLPEYSIEQKENGDIVILSESQDLIEHITQVSYSKLVNSRTGGPTPFRYFVKSDKELVIPYQEVKYSKLEPDSRYVFSLFIDDNSLFLLNEGLDKEVYIKTGSILLNSDFMSIVEEDNAVSILFENQDYLKKLENGTYLLTYHVINGVEKEKIISKDSIVIDYSQNKAYVLINSDSENEYMFNLMDGENCLAYGYYYSNGYPTIDKDNVYSQLDMAVLKTDATNYLKELCPNENITLNNYQAISVSNEYVYSEADNDKYFKMYGLSLDNSILMNINLNVHFKTNTSAWQYVQLPYDYPNKFITLEFTFSLDQMAKLGITKNNYLTQTVTVLREHNGKVDELAATVEPVTVNGTIISFKVTFKTDKMSLFSLTNKNSIVRPSSGGSGSGSSSTVTTPVKKPVVNTSAK